MNVKVTVYWDKGGEKEVTTLQELFDVCQPLDPEVNCWVQLNNNGDLISMTLDP